jgi:MYXO-CTERM domain-containing protein
MRCSPPFLALLAVIAWPGLARANGVTAHAHMTDLAIEELPPGELRDLMTDPAMRDAYRTGSVFPDSGYAAGDAYGEIAHWEAFTQSYLDWMATEHPPPYETDDERRLVAFLLGQASHGMADQVFDSLFMSRALAFDGDVSSLDEDEEYWLVVEHEPGIAPLVIWAPYDDLPDVFAAEREGHRPETTTIEFGLRRIGGVLDLLQASARAPYARTWSESPWAASSYYVESTPGSLPFIAPIIARYWQVLWERLHGTDSLERSVIGRFPDDGADNHEVDPRRPEARVMIVFGHGLDAMTLTRDNVVLETMDGVAVSANPRFVYGAPFANAVLVDPEETLAYDTTYRVTIGTRVQDIEGRALPTPVVSTFRTRCAADRLGDCPALPDPWTEPSGPPAGDAGPRADAGPPPDAAEVTDAAVSIGADASVLAMPTGGCGCHVPSAARGPSWLLVLVSLALVLARRR